jgi:hypothetical protein
MLKPIAPEMPAPRTSHVVAMVLKAMSKAHPAAGTDGDPLARALLAKPAGLCRAS